MDNMEIYNDLRSVPESAKKNFSNGRFSGTDINPMWRIKKLTERFGACGIGWYVEVVKREMLEGTAQPNGQKPLYTFVALNLYIKVGASWSKPIYGEGGNSVTQNKDEAYKMAYTDALSNASKMLGLGADVWYEKDTTKYTAAAQQQNTAALDRFYKWLDEPHSQADVEQVYATFLKTYPAYAGYKELQSKVDDVLNKLNAQAV